MNSQTASTIMTLRQRNKLIEVASHVLQEEGMGSVQGAQDFLGYSHLTKQLAIIARRAKKAAALVNDFKPSESQIRARSIMGKDFFGPEEAVKHFRAKWTREQLDILATVPFSEEVLTIRKGTHVLMAGHPLSIGDMIARYRARFHTGPTVTMSLYEDRHLYPALQERVGLCWYLISKTALDGTNGKSWEQQMALIDAEKEFSPRACVLAYAMLGHLLSTGERMFEPYYDYGEDDFCSPAVNSSSCIGDQPVHLAWSTDLNGSSHREKLCVQLEHRGYSTKALRLAVALHPR